jgi:hypothetical protein
MCDRRNEIILNSEIKCRIIYGEEYDIAKVLL